MEQVREIIIYGDYFREFYDKLPVKVKEKIDYVLFVVTHADRIPTKFLKHIEGQTGLYEIRIEVGNNIFRIFCCFDKGKVIVLFNAFNKKTQRTPKREIELAIILMNNYFEQK